MMAETTVDVEGPEPERIDTKEKANFSYSTDDGKQVALAANNGGKNAKKDMADVDEEGLKVLVTVPPDGGWGWIVVAASFVVNFIVDGITYCYGDFLPVIKEDFNETAAKVSMPGSFVAGFYLMTGPFVSALANKFGFQKVTIAGALFAAAAFALSSLAMNVDFIIVFYGLLGGIGFGLVYAPSIVIVGYYFERWRGLATGIAVCGSGIGTFAMSPINALLIDHLGWKNSFIVHGGMTLIIALCGFVFRPIKPVRVEIHDNDESERNEPEEKTSLRQKKMSLRSQKPPTAAEILGISDKISEVDMTPFSPENFQGDRKRHSVPNYANPSSPDNKARQERSMSHAVIGNKKDLNKLTEINSALSKSVECVIRSRRGTIMEIDEKVNLTIQRDDAFLTGSLLRLPEYKSEKDSITYTLSVTRIPPPEEKNDNFLKTLFKTIVDLFDFSLFFSPSFDLFLISGFFLMLGYFIPFSYVKDRAMQEGHWNDEDTKWLLSIIGITNTVGRIVSGFIASLPGADAILMNNAALVTAGIATGVSGLSFSAPFQYAYCALFGLSAAVFVSLRSIIVVEIVGLENLNNAFGVLLFVQGFSSAIGPPLAGIIREFTSNYDASFYFSGSLVVFSGILLFPLKAIKKWEKKKLQSKGEIE